MANIFISYGDNRFKESLNRIARQAKKMSFFDRVIKYTPKDLPSYIKSSPLFAFERGGGYWVWKPWIIYHTLQLCKIGDVVYYCDAGDTLVNDSPEWQMFQEQIQNHTAIVFQYREGFDYGWGVYKDKAAFKYWVKPSTAEFFKRYIDPDFMEYGEIWTGFLIFKKTKQTSIVLDQWYKTTLFHPELVIDSYGYDINDPYKAYHTHDQATLTPIVFHHHEEDNTLVLLETSESRIGNPAVLGTRWRQGAMTWWEKIKYITWRIIHGDI